MTWDIVLQQGGLAFVCVAACVACIALWRDGRAERQKCEERLDKLQQGRVDDLKLIMAAVNDHKDLVDAIERVLEREESRGRRP